MQRQLLILSASVLLLGRGQSPTEIVFRQQTLQPGFYSRDSLQYFPAGPEFQLTVESLRDYEATRKALRDDLTFR